MIRLNLMADMGNQMFQYAYARAISEEFRDKEIVINDTFSRFVHLYLLHSFRPYSNGLKHFYLNENVTFAKEDFKNFFITLYYAVFYCIYRKNLFCKPFSQKVYEKRTAKGLYQLTNRLWYAYYKHSPVSRKNKVVQDYFNNWRYFQNIRHILLKEFKVKTEPSIENQKMINEISSCNSVAVHIRRGDYTEKRFAHLKLCTEAYYKRGMDYVAQRVENPVFYIFSNNHEDIEWIKSNYHFDYPVKYMDFNNPGYEDYRLMYNCKHFIISNSTFSWWGSYMSENEEKIVVAPNKMTNIDVEGKDDNYRDDMIKLPVD